MRIGLVGCVKSKRSVASPAQDLYTSPLFLGRRAFVERTCKRWFILSAKHGLVDPATIVQPYDHTLTKASTEERRTWSENVLSELHRELGDLRGYTFEIHAGHAYADFGLTAGLRAAGAEI
jgi:hypothetical protein